MDGLLIGRFQPFHLGHLGAVRFALSRADRLLVGLGSSNRPRQRSNPFSAEERREMILSSVDPGTADRISTYPIPDLDDHQRWMEMVFSTVPKFDAVFTNDVLTRHLCSKHDIDTIPIPLTSRESLSGTNVRSLIAGGRRWEHLVPDGTRRFLSRTGARARLRGL